MSQTNPIYHYDYQALDALLKEDIPPEEYWQSLDEVLQILMSYLEISPAPPIEHAASLHYKIRVLRDIFHHLKPSS